ncbi:hypothetical protein GUJ93_ZPchr0010g10225 [Zizania palustris]|uniref:Uncharacterized protein n=1 Tax=Zizania palustris TaxID=103762 RepID=A0A8J5WG95_ZIZPA|nr:hypothetical protein GUJ93_ZPchr0010g10225 [Zizania palustris]
MSRLVRTAAACYGLISVAASLISAVTVFVAPVRCCGGFWQNKQNGAGPIYAICFFEGNRQEWLLPGKVSLNKKASTRET